MIKGLFPQTETSKTPEIIERVAKAYGIAPAQLKGRCRTRRIAFARHVAMYLSRMETEDTLGEIGTAFGNRDHGTVIYAVKKVKGIMDIDSNVRKFVQSLENDQAQRPRTNDDQ